MRISKKYPLLAKYFGIQLLGIGLAIGAGLAFTLVYIPYAKRSQVVAETLRGCEAIRRIMGDRGVGPEEALGVFNEVNRAFFRRGTALVPADDPSLAPETSRDPPCSEHWFPARESRLEMRLDEKTVLVTSILPPTPRHIQMKREGEGGSSYEVQHHHPVIFGMTPEGASAIVLVLCVVFGFLSTFFAGARIFATASKVAAGMLDRIRDGDFSARVPDSFTILARNFNGMANELEKLVHQLRESEGMRVRLLQELTHDLKTPVASLRGLVESIRDRHGSMGKAELEETVETAVRETIYFSRLVDDLLFMSGLKETPFRPETAKLDLAALVRAEAALFEKGGDVAIEVAAPVSVPYYGEEMLLHRMVRNGLDNAISFAESRVDVRFGETESYWTIEVVDDGRGPTDEEIAQFGSKRATRQVVVDQDGRISLGLGSVIMRKIARAYDGDAVLSRGPGGRGARLTLSLKKQ